MDWSSGFVFGGYVAIALAVGFVGLFLYERTSGKAPDGARVRQLFGMFLALSVFAFLYGAWRGPIG
jgi:hypothetical protein